MRLFNTLYIFLVTIFIVNAQQETTLSTILFHQQVYNPSVSGISENPTAGIIYRLQWVGYDGAPKTQIVNFSAPILKNKIGIGGTILNEKIGPIKNQRFTLDLAYHIQLSKQSKLSFGIKSGVNVYTADFSNIQLNNPNDPEFIYGNLRDTKPNFGGGITWVNKNTLISFASPNFIENKNINVLDYKSHYYLMACRNIKVNELWSLKAGFYIKAVSGAPIQVDIFNYIHYKNLIQAGIMYRTDDALSFQLGVQISNQFQLLYAYDWGLMNKKYNFSSNSHEFSVRFNLKKTNNWTVFY